MDKNMKSSGQIKSPEIVIQLFLVALALAFALRIWETDLTIPFNYWGDTIYELALAKSIAEGGWIWTIDRLGAPYDLNIVAFPQNLTVSSVAMKLISLFTAEPGLILNLFWVFAISITSILCHVAMRSLGVSRLSSVVFSILYAFLPYTFYRNTAHISLTYIFVPIISVYAVQVLAYARSFTGRECTAELEINTVLLVCASIAIGFDYVYNAFFSCMFLSAAGVFGAYSVKSLVPIKKVLPYILLIVLCSALNFLPSLISWADQGVPPNMGYKTAAEAEIYGLKIRHLISPVFSDVLSPQGVIYPLENENSSAKLGIVGGIGYLMAIVFALFGGRTIDGRSRWAAGVLVVLATLIATIGGLGAVFNVLITADIRAYNRIVVFIAYFSLFVFAVQFDRFRLTFYRLCKRRRLNSLYGSVPSFIACILLLTGLYDQGHAASGVVSGYEKYSGFVKEERDIVEKIERMYPRVGMVYQLPETLFPPDGGIEKMLTYDHGRPYLWSERIRWSWPSFSHARSEWNVSLGDVGGDIFIPRLVMSGFDGIWLDRFGYSDAELTGIEEILVAAIGGAGIESSKGRYLFFSLESYSESWKYSYPEKKRMEVKEKLLSPLVLDYSEGFYQEEIAVGGQRKVRWSEETSSIKVRNASEHDRAVKFTALLESNLGGKLTVKSGDFLEKVNLSSGLGQVHLEFIVAGNSQSVIEFRFEGTRIRAPEDTRVLYFAAINPVVSEEF